MYSVSQKNAPCRLVAIFPKRLGIFQPNFTCLLPVPICARLRIFIQLPATLTKLCHIKRDHPVHVMCAKCPPSAETHFLTFPKQLGIFSVNFTRLLSIHTYARIQIFLFNYLQLWRSYAILSATTQRAFRSMVDILSTLWLSRLIWHNFVKVADNWIIICSPAQIGTFNRQVKFGLKILTVWGKCQKMRFGWWWTFCAHGVNWVVTLNMQQLHQSCR